MSFKDLSTVIGTWVGIVAAITGAAFALNTYHMDAETRRAALSQQVNERVSYAFAIAQEFHSPAMMETRTALASAEGVCREPFNSNLRPAQAFALVGLFDRAKMCADIGLCDRETLRSLLSTYADNLGNVLSYHVAIQRRENPHYGDGLLSLAADPAKQAQIVNATLSSCHSNDPAAGVAQLFVLPQGELPPPN